MTPLYHLQSSPGYPLRLNVHQLVTDPENQSQIVQEIGPQKRMVSSLERVHVHPTQVELEDVWRTSKIYGILCHLLASCLLVKPVTKTMTDEVNHSSLKL